jgi:adenine/guanine phosphoribosyltransferase-like PRPP-binding protein
LVQRLGGEVVGVAVAVELGFLNGRQQLDGYSVTSLLSF